jgi:hypothetical protein
MTTTLAARARHAAAVVAILVTVGALGSAAVAAVRTTATGPPDPSATAPPPPPQLGETVGVLGLDGEPVLAPDGTPAEVVLTPSPPGPPPPDPGDRPSLEVVGPGEVVDDVGLLDAHGRTLGELARRLDYDLLETYDLFAVNDLLTPADPDRQGVGDLRRLLADSERRARFADPTAACGRLAFAAALVDGHAPDAVGGLGAGEVAAALAAQQSELGC